MRIEITPNGVRVWHGLNDEGDLKMEFKTNDHITVDVDASINPNDITFRTGKFVGYPGSREEARTVFARQQADLVVRDAG